MLAAWRSIRALPRWLQAVIVGHFVNYVGSFATLFITLYLVQSRHAASSTAGLISASLGAGMIIGNFTGGSVGDRIGVRRALVGSLLVWAALISVVPVASVGLLAPLVLVAGFGSGAARPLTGAVVLAAVARERKREGAAAFRVVSNAAMAIGPPAAGILTGRHFGSLFVLDGLSSLVLAALVWRFVPDELTRRARPDGSKGDADLPVTRLWSALAAEPLVLAILLTIALVDTSYRQLFVTFPLELSRLGEPNVVYGVLVAVNCLLIVLFEVPVTLRLAARRATAVIASGYALVGVGWVVFGAGPSLLTAAAAMGVTTFGEMLYKPTAMGTVAGAAPDGFEGRFQSMYSGASVAGVVCAPAVGGWLYGVARPAVWFGAAGLALVAAAALQGHRVTQVTSNAGS